MCNKKMIHVFNEMVVKAGRNVDTADLCFINGGVSATFFCAQQAHHAAHAINNHDRLTEENKQLREFVKMIANGRTNDPESAVIHLKIHSNAAKEILNK